MTRRSRRSAAAVLLAAAGLALGACGADDTADSAAAEPLGEVRVGSVAQLAQCEDWAGGDREEQLATIADIREQINLEDGPVQTPELSDEAATEVFDSTCANDFAAGFRLYKIYGKAMGFASYIE